MSSNKGKIFLVEKGEGIPLILLYGFPQTHALWSEVATLLSKNYRLICPDLRGYGKSGKPLVYENYTFRNMAKDMIVILHSLNIKKAHFIGHDRGERVVYRLAIDHPELVSSAMLMDLVPTHKYFLSYLRH